MAFKRDKGDPRDFTLTENELPDSDIQCEIIAKQYGFSAPRIHIATFCPVKGWRDNERISCGFDQVYAWKPLSKEVSDLIKAHTKKETE